MKKFYYHKKKAGIPFKGTLAFYSASNIFVNLPQGSSDFGK